MGVLAWIDEAGLEEEVPQVVKVHLGTDVGLLVDHLVQYGEELHVVVDLHVQDGQAAAHRFLPAPLPRRVPGDHLRETGEAEPLGEADPEPGYQHPRHQHAVPFALLHREAGAREVGHLQVDPLVDQGVIEDDVGRGNQFLPLVSVPLCLEPPDAVMELPEHEGAAASGRLLRDDLEGTGIDDLAVPHEPQVHRRFRVDPVQRLRLLADTGGSERHRSEVDQVAV